MFILESPMAFMSGIWQHRVQTPCTALAARGHAVKQIAIGTEFSEEQMNWPDVVIFGRSYGSQFDPIKIMNDFKKRGKRVLYDMDDNFWAVPSDNPSVLVSNAHKDQYEGMIQAADACITPSPYLAKIFKKHFKKDIAHAPNGIDHNHYQERAHDHQDVIKIGYMGAASHWKDLQLIGNVIADLNKKYDFLFTIYGLVGEPLEAAIYTYKKILFHQFAPEKAAYHKAAIEFYEQLQGTRMWHVPFMPPELHPHTLRSCDLDIGIAPLADTEFNRGKSNIKFYEYAAVGTVTVASDVLPYSDEVGYTAKNTHKDWYNKLEKLIVDADYRKKLLAEQQAWVKKHRSLEALGLDWELALQKQSKFGMKVLNQFKR